MSKTNNKQSITKLLPQLKNCIGDKHFKKLNTAAKVNCLLADMGLLQPLDTVSKSTYPRNFKGKWGLTPKGIYYSGEYRTGNVGTFYHKIVWIPEIVEMIAGYISSQENPNDNILHEELKGLYQMAF